MLESKELERIAYAKITEEILGKLSPAERDSIIKQSLEKHLKKMTLTYETETVLNEEMKKQLAKILTEEDWAKKIDGICRRALASILPTLEASVAECFLSFFSGTDKYHMPRIYEAMEKHLADIYPAIRKKD